MGEQESGAGTPFIEVESLTTGYSVGSGAAIEDISFSVPGATLVGLLGGNGSGKSTLLKAMMGLLPTWSGQTRFWGQPVDAVRSRVGYMPQAEDVDWEFPVCVREVVGMGLYRRGFAPGRLFGRDQANVDAALERLGIGELRDRQIGELSGGQQKRVLLARTLVKERMPSC